MKWFSALIAGATLAVAAPMFLGGRGGVWMSGVTKTGTIAPFDHSPGLLFSIPLFLLAAFGLRMFFSWHDS